MAPLEIVGVFTPGPSFTREGRNGWARKARRRRSLARARLASAFLVLMLVGGCATTKSGAATPRVTASASAGASATPSVTAKRVFFDAGDTVVALDAGTGATLRTFDTGEHSGEGSISTLLMADDLVFFFDKNRALARRKLRGFNPSGSAGFRGLSQQSCCPTDVVQPDWNPHV